MTKRVTLSLMLSFLWASFALAQNVAVRGVVKDAGGLPLPGVSVLLQSDRKVATSSAINGEFSLNVPADGALVFSYMGYLTKVVPVNNQTTLNITLAEDVQLLNEVVVIGYGTQKKENLSGAVTSVSGAELANIPVPNLTAALQGVAPGVTVIRSGGKPGSEGYAVRIRGFSSANDANALVLVDGIEQDMNLINPDDVESISVLKDASAAAIYGARAAAGVVLVTTKKGSGGKMKVNFNNFYGLNITARQPERLNSWDEQTLINESRLNATGAQEFSDEQIEWLKNPNFNYRPNPTQDRWEYFGNNNWLKEGMDKVNSMQNYALSVSGGEQKLNYLISGGYYARDGVLAYGPDGNSRTNLKLNLNAELNKYVSVGVVGGYIGSYIEQNAFGTEQIINRLYRSRTRQSLYTPEEDITGQIYNGDLQINAIDIQKNAGLETRNYETFTGKLNFTVKNLVKGLTLDLIGWRNQNNYAMENNRRSLSWYGRTTNTVRFSANLPNSMSMTKNKGYQNNLQGYFNYSLQLAQKHNFKLLAGSSFEEYRRDEVSASAQSMITNDFFSFNFADPLTKTNSDRVDTWALGSYFGRFNYNFSEKYLFEASFRYDGSSRLAPENRWQLFPSFSGAWRVSEEAFMKEKLPFLSELKVRGSWGQLGNGSVLGLYDYIPLLTSGLTVTNQPNLVFNGVRSQYLFQSALASPDKTWETVETSNVGIDAGFFMNRLNVTSDYYIKRNKNMLATLNVPNIIGIPVGSTNVGELKSWGWEFEVKWRDKIKNGNYSIGFNISDNQNELTRYNGRNSIGNGGVVPLMEGYPLNSVWGYKTNGYFQTQQEADAYKAQVKYPFFANPGAGDVKYLDLNGDGLINPGDGTPQNSGDLMYLGTTNSRYTFGTDLGFGFKNFDFSVFLQGAAKRSFLIDEGTLSPMLGTADMPWTIHMDRWSPENPNAMFPRMYQTSAHNFRPSDKWTQNGNYIRLKNVQVGYTVPVNKKYMQNLRVYFSGQDLLEKTKVLSVFDPEAGNGASATDYPFYRTVSFGLNVTL